MGRKILSVFAAFAVALSLAGCQSEPLSESDGAVVEEAAESIEMNTIEPPENGWTVEQLNEVMYLNGKPFKLPCTLEELGEDFSIKNIKEKQTVPFEKDNANSEYVNAELYYNGNMVGYVDMERGEKDDYTVWGIAYLNSSSEGESSNSLNINGVNIYSTKSDVERLLGNNFIESQVNGLYNYIINETTELTVVYIVDTESPDKTSDEIFSISYYCYQS